jgi:rfaE bifunctional protein kinase chain/domain
LRPPELPALDPARARELIRRFPGRSVLVVGDVMVDNFVVGRVDRISPEAPVPIVRYEREHDRLGGAANVAHAVTALGGRPALVGVAGTDAAGDRLAAALAAAGIAAAGIVRDGHRRTTLKLRLVTERHHQVARLDVEDEAEIAGEVEARVCERVAQAAASVDAIVISDYLKGAITPAVAACAIDAGRARGVPVLVDPKVAHLPRYHGATIVTPNCGEAEAATHVRLRTPLDMASAARAICEQAGCESVLVTLGDRGMWLLGRRRTGAADVPEVQEEGLLPASAREVADVTGAGDTVIATLALGLAAGGTLVEAAHLANQAAGIAVGKFGPAVVTPQELIAPLPA